MAQRPLSLNIEYFPDPAKGQPIGLGNVYIGTKDTDPEVLGNRIDVVVVEEDGTETTILPAGQPFTLGAGGVILYGGSPAVVLVDGVYSVKVTDSLGSQKYYVPRANEYLEEISTTSGLLLLNGSFEADNEDSPRIRIFDPPLGPPSVTIETPATFPASSC